MRGPRALTSILLIVGAGACGERRDPPGVELCPAGPVRVVAGMNGALERDAPGGASATPGTAADALPFVPTGTRLASIAWRTWIYSDTGPSRTRYGYLRAGAVVDARGPAIVNEGCAGGWYRVNPRGFVCIGKGATLDVTRDPIVVSVRRPPNRSGGLPYPYVMANEEAPHRYFRLASAKEMRDAEGDGIAGRVANWRAREQVRGSLTGLGEITAPPPFLSTTSAVQKPYGVESGLHYTAHAGRAASGSGFALLEVFEWEGRVMGLTTGFDIIPLDRTEVIRQSEFHGVELGRDESLPVGMVRGYRLKRSSLDGGRLVAAGEYRHREWVKITGESGSGAQAMRPTSDGGWVPLNGLRVVEPRTSFPSFATGQRKWLDISIKDQTLVAYEGLKPVYVTLVSTGRGGVGDPEKVDATVRGTFMVHAKHLSATMDGNEDKADSYALEDVPFVQYFHKGYALHGAYWHDEFGKIRSHGCINLAPIDAAWLFEWTDPAVPPGWHGVINKERGTVVYVRP
ncbi:MAG: L,D-transpeptidase [Polyangiaceae bacterium]|nr:L,D-transpeptidase [Polyangiaceae bacterium]